MAHDLSPAQPAVAAGITLATAVWRQRAVVILVALAASLTGFGLSHLQAPMYDGTARLLLSDPRNVGVFREQSRVTVDPMRYVRNQASVAISAPVLQRAGEMVGAGLPLETLQERVRVTPAFDQDLLTITASAPSARAAAGLANAVADAYQETVVDEVQRNAERSVAELAEAESELQAQVDAANQALQRNRNDASLQAERDAVVAQLIDMQARRKQVSVDASLHGAGVAMFEPAQTPTEPSSPQPVRNGVVAGLLGTLLAFGFAWWRAQQFGAAESRQDAAPILRAPLLGEVPDFSSVGVDGPLPSVHSPHSGAAEAYNFIISSLDSALRASGCGDQAMLLITSARPSDGKSTTTANLAVAAARGDRTVTLVDADIRARGLSQLMKMLPYEGLTEVGRGLPLQGRVRPLPQRPTSRLGILPAGATVDDAAGFFRSSGFRATMTQLRGQADILLADSPPLLAISDASAIASQADGIVLVVARGTPLRLLEDVRQRLDFIGTPLLGYIFNRSQARGSQYGYAGYASHPQASNRPRRRARALVGSRS